jgi:hypothetical protein
MALRVRTGTLDLESRPLSSSTRDKKLNFLQRWIINHHQHRRSTTVSNGGGDDGGAATATTTASASALDYNTDNHNIESMLSSASPPSMLTPSVPATTFRSTSTTRAQYNITTATTSHNMRLMPSSSLTTWNILEWMQAECPVGILPRILAYAGPQTSMALSKTNHFWNQVLQDDATWRVMCEELYKVRTMTNERICHFSRNFRSPSKNPIFPFVDFVVLFFLEILQWKEGDDVPDLSWRDFYKYNPCVPVDYSTFHAAMAIVDVARNDTAAQPTSVRLLLRPGRYILRDAITIQDNNDNNAAAAAAANAPPNTIVRPNSRPIAVEIVTMNHFPESFFPSALEAARNVSCSLVEPERSKKRKTTIRQIFQCRTVDIEEQDSHDNVAMDVDVEDGLPPAELLLENQQLDASDIRPSSSSKATVNRASLILRTRRHNEPLIRVRQGTCTIRNIEIKHNSNGTGM